jgi:hypothetical protein
MRRFFLIASILALLGSDTLRAQIRVSPTGVSVNAMAATTVFLTFGGVGALVPAEAFWCGEVVPATPHVGRRCNPATLFGQLPGRSDLSRRNAGAFTDIMSIPPSVARRAYQAAVDGATSTFFYVRRFQNVAGGPDEYVVVTCRLTGGGARVPFALTDIRIAFDPAAPVLFVGPGGTLPPLAAEIVHNGTGRLIGRWEVVLPGEEPPSETDLLTEATLPLADRATQRRYSLVERFNIFLPPNGRITLPGPDPSKLPTAAEGAYLILLRIEATDDREGDSDLAAAGAGSGIVHSGAVAGFPMPVLSYVVGSSEGVPAASESPRALRLLRPDDGALFSTDSTLAVDWADEWGASYYRVEFRGASGSLLEAFVRKGSTRYEAPPLVRERAAGGDVRWRVIALDAGGRTLRTSAWRRLRFSGGP